MNVVPRSTLSRIPGPPRCVTDEDLSARLRTVERAVTDGEELPDLSAAADAERRLDALESEMEALAERVDALDATVQSLHGYVGELEHVNDRVERRADAARAAVERFEERRTAPGEASDSTGDDGQRGGDERGEGGKRASETALADDESHHGRPRSADRRRRADESLLGRVRDAL